MRHIPEMGPWGRGGSGQGVPSSRGLDPGHLPWRTPEIGAVGPHPAVGTGPRLLTPGTPILEPIPEPLLFCRMGCAGVRLEVMVPAQSCGAESNPYHLDPGSHHRSLPRLLCCALTHTESPWPIGSSYFLLQYVPVHCPQDLHPRDLCD